MAIFAKFIPEPIGKQWLVKTHAVLVLQLLVFSILLSIPDDGHAIGSSGNFCQAGPGLGKVHFVEAGGLKYLDLTTGTETTLYSPAASASVINDSSYNHEQGLLYYVKNAGDTLNTAIHWFDVHTGVEGVLTPNINTQLAANGYTGGNLTTASGGGVFLNGHFYFGTDLNTAGTAAFEVIDIVPSADGKSIVSATGMTKGQSGTDHNLTATSSPYQMDINANWGDVGAQIVGGVPHLVGGTVNCLNPGVAYEACNWTWNLNTNVVKNFSRANSGGQFGYSENGKLLYFPSAGTVETVDVSAAGDLTYTSTGIATPGAFDASGCMAYDYGDSPFTAQTNYLSGAKHVLSGLRLGALLDGDVTPHISADASGDDTSGFDVDGQDDDDGVAAFSLLTVGDTSYSVDATCSGGSGSVAGWIDFDANGAFDADEKSATASCNNATVSLSWVVPNDTVAGDAFARFRIAPTASEVAAPTGLATGGEVEDYPITIAPSGNFTINTSEGGRCVAAGGTLGTTNLFTDLDNGSFGTGSGAVDEIPSSDPYGAQITGGTFINTFSGFSHGNYTYISNHQTPRNGSQHGNGIYDPVNGVNGRFFISDPDTSSPEFSSSLSGLTTGESYEISFWAADSELNASNYNRIGIFANSVEVYNTGFIANTTSTMEWKKYSFVYIHNDVSATVNFDIKALEAGIIGRDIFFDEINVYECNLPKDLSDAPISGVAPDGTSAINYGEAIHAIASGVQLGAAIDEDTASIASIDASGDGNDDDGVTLPVLTQAATVTIPVAVSQIAANDGYLQAWIDWNGDGDFLDANEQIASDLQYSSGTNGTINITVQVPYFAVTSETFARFRWSTDSGLNSTASAPDGEVEDYAVTIAPLVVPSADIASCSPSWYSVINWATDAPAFASPLNAPTSNTFTKAGITTTINVAPGVAPAGANAKIIPYSTTYVVDAGGNPIIEASYADFTFDFSRPVDQLRWYWTDFDANESGTVYGELNGVRVTPSIADGPQNTATILKVVNADGSVTFERLAGENNLLNDEEVAVFIGFDTPVDKIVVSHTPRVFSNDTSSSGSIGAGDLQLCVDMGDAPDTATNTGTDNYQTLASDNGPLHIINGAVGLGVVTDNGDSDGFHEGSDDNNDASDDSGDDGVVVSGASLQGQGFSKEESSTLDITTVGSGVLNAWIDWNRNGNFNDAGEQIALDVAPSANAISILLTVPLSAVGGDTYARFRFSSDTGLGATGAASDGEVEDYAVAVLQEDWGDAPDSYGTTKAANGAQHDVINDVYLGAARPDTEADGVATIGADGDNAGGDEDGVVSMSPLSLLDGSYSITVNATNASANAGRLMAWIDVDLNGTFDMDEAAARVIPAGTAASDFVVTWSSIPADIQPGNSYLRLRFTTDSINAGEPTGAKLDGEVEDYALAIVSSGFILSGQVYVDTNSDASINIGESGIAGTVVVLRDVALGTCRSVNTNGSGNYQFSGVIDGSYEVYQAHGETTSVPQNCGTSFANNPTGYQSTTPDTLFVAVSGNDVIAQNFGEVAGTNSTISGNTGVGIAFEPDHQSEILPGNTTFYAHVFSTEADGTVRFTTAAGGNTSSGWTHTLYQDSNCDGVLNGIEANTAISGINFGVTADSRLCIIDKVYAPANVPAQDQYEVTTTATFTYAGGALPDASLDVTDLTLAGQTAAPTTQVNLQTGESRLDLTKTVENLTQTTPETETLNQALPSDVLKYRIYYRNTGSGPITDLSVDDTVPPFTGFVNSSNLCDVTPTGMTCSAIVASDQLQWRFTGTLQSGAFGHVSYEVVVDN